MHGKLAILLVATVALLGMVQTVMAHPGHPGHGFENGWQHSWLAWDLLLAIIAVGLLAYCMGGKALWARPVAFATAIRRNLAGRRRSP